MAYPLADVDPVAFILSNNIQRRHLSKGQQAMAVAKARQYKNYTPDQEGVVSKQYVSFATTVLKFAPELASGILAGDMPLADGYAVALARKHRTDEAQQEDAQLILQRRQQSRYLAHAAPDLAEEVSQERKTLEDAMAVLARLPVHAA